MSFVNHAVITRLRSLSFDCYGTLIDWIAGIRGVFRTLAASGGLLPADEDAFFDAYLQAEAEVEAGPYVPYRQVLTNVQAALARRFGLDFPPQQATLLADSQAGWRPFPDTNAALTRLQKRLRLGVLSNIDRAMFAATCRHFEVGFDFVITAEDVGAYKPARPHFERLLQAEVRDASTHLHVAQSLFHDGVPAADLGIPFVWINRRGETNDTAAGPLATYATLGELADALEA